MERYVDLFRSGYMASPFPHVLILSEQRYALDMNYPFMLFQAESFTSFINCLKPELKDEKVRSTGIRIRVG